MINNGFYQCDSALYAYSECQTFAFENSSDEFLPEICCWYDSVTNSAPMVLGNQQNQQQQQQQEHYNTMVGIPPYQQQQQQHQQLPLPPLRKKIELPKIDEIMYMIENRNSELYRKVAQVEHQCLFTRPVIKLESPTGVSVFPSESSTTLSPESLHNASTTATATRKNKYNLRSRQVQKKQTVLNTSSSPSLKRRSLADSSDDDSSCSGSSRSSSEEDDDDEQFNDFPTTSTTTATASSDIPTSSLLVIQKERKNRHSNASSTSQQPKKKRKRTTYKKEHIDVLKNFILTHTHYPYPTEEEKQDLLISIDHGMSKEQLETWFVNHRKRYLPLANLTKAHYHSAPSKSGFNKELEKKLKQEETATNKKNR